VTGLLIDSAASVRVGFAVSPVLLALAAGVFAVLLMFGRERR
jgi:hypothetical protein